MQDSLEEISDEALVGQVCGGDRQAFACLVNRHGLRFRAIAMRTCGDQMMAEEMVQEAFVKLWTRSDRFDQGKAKFTTWFHRVVVNRCLDELRRRRPTALPEGYDAADTRPGADTLIGQEGSSKHLAAALARLSERQRNALTLSYMDGYSNSEAADIMELNIKAYESLLARARAKMRALLGREKTDLLSAFA